MIRSLSIAIVISLCGCGPYILQGKVLEGSDSGVQFVSPDHPWLEQFGMDRATYQLMLDPKSLGRKVIADGTVSPDGSFSIPIREPGAGFLEYEFEIVVRQKGYNSAVSIFQLPAKNQRLLVLLAPGPDRYRPPNDPMRDTQEYLRD